MDAQMPMQAAAQLPLNTDEIIGAMPQRRSAAPDAMPPAAQGLVGLPQPGAPEEPPFDVQLQPDGSSIYLTKTDPPIVIGVNKPPKLPPGLAPK